MRDKLRFGVFRTDCYKMGRLKMERMFLKSFDNYGCAFEYARAYSNDSNDTVIHLTCLIKEA